MIVKVFRVFVNIFRLFFKGVKTKGFCTTYLSTKWIIKNKGTINLGTHFCALENCKFNANGGHIVIGNNVGFNSNCVVASHCKIEIGNNVEVGPNVCIFDHDHDYRVSGGIKTNKYLADSVSIGDNTWIGANCVILKGAKIGNNCVVAAGSIVRQSIPDNCVFYQRKDGVIKEYETY